MKKVVIIFLAAVFMLAMYVPVSAADWDLYGSARVTTFWTDEDEADTTSFNHSLQGNARVGGSVDHGILGGGFEYGATGGLDDSSANVRLLYATVDMPFGELKIGQDYAPFGAGSFLSTQVYNSDENMLQFVGYTGWQQMVQLSIEGFKIALVNPNFDETFDIDPDDGSISQVATDNPEILLPQLQLSYDMMVMPAFALNFAGVVQSYDLDDGDGDTLTSWAIAANARLTMMDPLYVNFGGFYGQNVSHFGQYGQGYTSGAYTGDTDDVNDTDTYGALLVVGTKINTIGLEAGVGYRESDFDNGDIDFMAYYLAAKLPLSPEGNAFIQPEIGFYDYDEEDEFYAGLQWRVDF